MARLAAQSLLGFYAQPPEMTELVNKKLTLDEGATVNILDSCCGNGEALRQIQDHLTDIGGMVTSYGNELEKGRYTEACKVLDHVINGGYEGLRTSPAHTLLWGNPPYDEGPMERMELTFIKLHLRKNRQASKDNKNNDKGQQEGGEGQVGKQMLQRGAVVCLCIPQEVLKDVANFISKRLDDISVYRYTDEFYPRFRQVVLFGYFSDPKNEVTKKNREWLKLVAEKGPDALPTLDTNDGKVYRIPAAQSKVEFFRKEALDSEELLKDLTGSPLFKEVEEMFMPSSLNNGKLKRPPLPLKPAHIAQAITSGAVDGNFGTFYMTGYTELIKEKVDIRNEEGKVTGEEHITRPTPVAQIFSPEHGIIEIK